MKKFKKRTYKNIKYFWSDFTFLINNIKKIKDAMKGTLISPVFRERLMIAVTAVNDCRYCSYYHSKIALTKGLTKEEIDRLLKGSFNDCPDNEINAILYAQHWAEKDTKPDVEVKQKLLDIYDKNLCEEIELILRTIRFGNLLGNTWDYFIYKVSFGLLGR